MARAEKINHMQWRQISEQVVYASSSIFKKNLPDGKCFVGGTDFDTVLLKRIPESIAGAIIRK